ncbi:PAAR domain-containing protein [Paraburkholderia sartisoli]|uniref:PAAR motif-containing protein n=1 Tax=Paraburkholderia sartisoli TaxID=83784 RepID=A0A1H4A9W6_9BURK|nr:PAAR domain-containing protein [Paraburkholderia sartisoli]SEA32710.1 PAAR motif-containing protein [Paraburkholderia sartisoli]
MRRYNLRENDKSTSGGIVIEGIPDDTLDGVPLTFLGAKVVCPACKRTGVIVGQGPRYPDISMGKQMALDNDICVCGCEPPPRMRASQKRMFEDHLESNIANRWRTDNDEPARRSAAPASSPQYVRWFYVRNSTTGQRLAHRDFVADVGGARQSGKTDAEGYAKITTSSEQPVSIHVVFSSPRRTLKPRQGA